MAPWILVATILGSSMAFIDGTVVNVALPVLQRDLNATVAGAQWIVEAYGLFLAALLLVGGSLGDRFGRRRMFALGIIIFTVASMACGLSRSLEQLIAARAVQGLGAALLTPESLAIISVSFEGESRGKAIGTWSGFTALTAAAGPVIGGWLIGAGSWRYAFFMNVPLALVVLAVTYWRVPETFGQGAGSRLDWRGALLATAGLGGLVFGLVTASTTGFGTAPVIASLLVGVVLLAVFLAVESQVGMPMVPLGLFRSRVFSGANIFTLLLYSALSGALFFFPFNLIQVQGYTPAEAGVALLPFVLLMFLLSRWSGGLVGHYGARLPLICGPLVAGTGFLLFARPSIGGGYWTTFFPAVVVLGLGMAISVAPLTTTAMNAVDTAQSGLASGINNAVSRTAGVLAVAVLSLFVVSAFDTGLNARLGALSVAPQTRQALLAQHTKLAGIEIPADVTGATRAALQGAISASFVDGFRSAMFIAAGLAAAASLSAAVTMPTASRNRRTPRTGPAVPRPAAS